MTCPFCHRETPRPERHHLAGAANARTLTIRACEHCHRELTSRQLDAGVLLDHRASRDEHDRAWALIHGLSDLVVAPADDRDENAPTVERVVLLAGRAIAGMSDHPIGPDPVAASARDTTRQLEREPGARLGTPTLETWAASFAAMASACARAWTDELGETIGLPQNKSEYLTLLERLEQSPHAEILLADLAEMRGWVESAVLDPPGAVELDMIELRLRSLLALLSRVAGARSDEEAAALMEASL